jgi:uncharacterized YkwD family protein
VKQIDVSRSTKQLRRRSHLVKLKQFGIKTSLAVTAASLVGVGFLPFAQSAYAATNSFGNSNLSYGSYGRDVRVVQLALQNFGAFPSTTAATSYFGSVTKAAVETFQKDMGLQVDGIVGPRTKQTLMKVGYQEYVVGSGDTLWSIGKQYGESSTQIMQENHLSSSNLSVGQALLLHVQKQTSSSQTAQTQQSSLITPQVQQVVNLVNQERAKNGLKPLTIDMKLTQMAHDKAVDMRDNNYFDHQSPTYGSPFDMMNKYGITYSYAGENIAAGQQTAQDVMNSWMNSSGHRANILNPNYTEIGVGFVQGGQYGTEWVQEFIKP